MRLFARDIKANIKEYNINQIEDTNFASIKTGRLNGNLIETIITHPTDIKKEIASRIAKKRKEGYVSLKDTGYDNNFSNQEDFIQGGWLEANLPKCNTDANNNLKPMKCQRFQEGKTKYPVLAQPKLNGLRGVLRWEQWNEGEGMFTQIVEGAKIRTKEGNEYVMPHITNNLTKDMFESEIGELVFDGELYKHGMGLNVIKSSCPMTNSRGTISRPSGNPLDISFYIFDLAIPDIPQDSRLLNLDDLNIYNNNIHQIPSIIIHNDEEVLKYRDKCIFEEYEGCVTREIDQEYAFGFRPSFMRKCKIYIDSEFLILDVISQKVDSTLPEFVCKNDINDATFESTPIGAKDKQREMLLHKEDYIGMWATVRYRERTGTIDRKPFHTNVISIRKLKGDG